MLFKKTLLASALLALGGVAVSASGATNPASATFQVKLKINKACTVATTGDLNFNSADADSTADLTQSASSIDVTCSKKTAYSVDLKPTSSNSVDGTGTMKGALSGNTDTIAYALYQDAGNSIPWGSGANTLKAPTLVPGDGSKKTYTVYGKVLGSLLNVQPDDYADTVTVTVAY